MSIMSTKTISKNIKWPPCWQDGVIRTSNSMGIMTTDFSPSTVAFIDYAATAQKPVLDIGCAYGAATFSALENGANVIACDIGEEHIDFIAKNTEEKFKHKLDLVQGDFLSDLHLEENSLSAIHISMVLHFLTGEQIELALKKFHTWLEPNGKLFIVNMTADLGIYNQETLHNEINKKKLSGDKWPGAVNQKLFIREEYIPHVPELAHFLDIDTLTPVLKENNFEIEWIDYFRYDNIPDFYRTTGKEYVAAISKKSSLGFTFLSK